MAQSTIELKMAKRVVFTGRVDPLVIKRQVGDKVRKLVIDINATTKTERALLK